MNDDEADRYPEVFVGRLTPYCSQEVNNWINKVFGYERIPNLIHTSALWLYAGMEIGDAPSVFADFFTHYYIEMNNAQEVAENYLSQGYGINNIHCHGVRDTFSDWGSTIHVAAYWPYSPSSSYDGLNNLMNFNKYYFTVAVIMRNIVPRKPSVRFLNLHVVDNLLVQMSSFPIHNVLLISQHLLKRI